MPIKKNTKSRNSRSITAKLSNMGFGSRGPSAARTVMSSPKLAIPSGTRPVFQMASPTPGIRITTRDVIGARAPADGGLTQEQFNELQRTEPERYASVRQLLVRAADSYVNLYPGKTAEEIAAIKVANPKIRPFIEKEEQNRLLAMGGGKCRYSKTRSKKRR